MAAQDAGQKGLADLIVDGNRVGAIQFELGTGGELLVSTSDLKAALEKSLNPAIAASLFEKDRSIGVAELGL